MKRCRASIRSRGATSKKWRTAFGAGVSLPAPALRLGADSSSRVLAFTASMLASPRSARPATAHAFGQALAEILD